MNAKRLKEIRTVARIAFMRAPDRTTVETGPGGQWGLVQELLAYVDTLLAERKRLKRRIKDLELAYDFKSSLEPVRWTGMSKH